MTIIGRRFCSGIAALGLGAAGLFAVAAPASASFAGTNGRIFFDAQLDAAPQRDAIFSVNADGSDLEQLTDGSSDALAPDVSADGTKVAFDDNVSGHFELWTMNADGTNQQPLTSDGQDDEYPSWSPDGSQLVFRQTTSTNLGDIFLIPATGGTETQLTTTAGLDSLPEWSAVTNKIAFHSSRDDASPDTCGGSCVQSVYTMNPDGSGQTQLVYTPNMRNRFPNWSPDGSQLVLEHHTLDVSASEIDIVNADGSGLTPFAPADTTTPDYTAGDSVAPDWSPAGDQITWSSVGALFTAPVGGGSPTEIVGNQGFYVLSPDWSTDPTTVVTSTTAVSASPSSAVFGQPVTLAAVVSNHGGATASPTGTVSFAVNGTVVAPAVALRNGRANYTSKKLAPGVDRITATYSGDGAHTPSSATVPVQVDNTPATGTLSVTDGAEIAFGTTVSAHFSAEPPSTAPVPNGNYASATVNGSSTGALPVKNGTVVIPAADLPAGNDSVQVCITNAPGFDSTCTDTVTITVDQVSTTTALTSSANPAAPRQKITLIARVSPAAATGSITFFVDGAAIGTVPLAKGRAKLTTKFAASDTYQITASYSGDQNYAASDSNEVDQQVQ